MRSSLWKRSLGDSPVSCKSNSDIFAFFKVKLGPHNHRRVKINNLPILDKEEQKFEVIFTLDLEMVTSKTISIEASKDFISGPQLFRASFLVSGGSVINRAYPV